MCLEGTFFSALTIFVNYFSFIHIIFWTLEAMEMCKYCNGTEVTFFKCH
jgi:hypothetical protein